MHVIWDWGEKCEIHIASYLDYLVRDSTVLSQGLIFQVSLQLL